jgi:hypothetical protein
MKRGMDQIGRTVTLEKAKRGCLEKYRYESKNAARDAAVRVERKRPEWGPMRPYRCGLCDGYHLTTKQPYGLTMRPKTA